MEPPSGRADVNAGAAAAGAAASRRAWLLVAFMWVAFCLNYADRQVVFSIFPLLRKELGFSDAQLGLTGSIFLWVYALCSPVAGQAGDWFSRRALVVTSLVLWSAATALTGLSTSPTMLLSLRALIGVTESLFMPAALALVASAHRPDSRSRAISVFATAQLAGVVLGGWFGGYMAQEFHWRLAFFVLGSVGIFYAVPYAAFMRRTPEGGRAGGARERTGMAFAVLARIPSYRVLCTVYPVFTFTLWLFYTWLPAFYHERFSLTLQESALTATAFLQAGDLVGTIAGGVLADWLYRRTKAARFWLCGAGLLMCAPCAYVVGATESLLLSKAAVAGFGLTSGLFLHHVAAFDVIPAHTRASSVGCFNLMGALSGGFAPLVAGLLNRSVGVGMLIGYSALACFAAGVFLLVGTKRYFHTDHERAESWRATEREA